MHVSTSFCFAEEGDLRLVDRVDVNGFATGALQIFLDGAFGAVCGAVFGPADADVACRQLGFVGGTSLPTAISARDEVQDQGSRRAQLQVLDLYKVLCGLLRGDAGVAAATGHQRAVHRASPYLPP